MAFSRKIMPREEHLDQQKLNGDLVGIGMNFGTNGTENPNIEDTILRASIEGLENDDLRVLSVLTTWLEVHFAALNVDRLTRIVAAHPGARVRAYWSSIARWLKADRRFAKMAHIYKGEQVNLLTAGSDFQIKRRGEDQRFAGAPMRVPAGVLRDRPEDVLSPAQLAQVHKGYQWRTVIGPSYRGDMWAELVKHPNLSAAELARRAYGSFATAWAVKRDWNVLHPHLGH